MNKKLFTKKDISAEAQAEALRWQELEAYNNTDSTLLHSTSRNKVWRNISVDGGNVLFTYLDGKTLTLTEQQLNNLLLTQQAKQSVNTATAAVNKAAATSPVKAGE